MIPVDTKALSKWHEACNLGVRSEQLGVPVTSHHDLRSLVPRAPL